METSADHSIRNDWKNKHFPATPCFKLAYKSVNETIFLLSIITRYHRLALALPQFVELNRSTGLRLIGPFTTKSRFLSDFETNWNELLKFLPQWLKCPLYIFRFFFIFLFIHFFFNLIRRVSREFSLHDQQIWDVFLTGTYKSVYIRSFHGRIIRNSDPWWEIFRSRTIKLCNAKSTSRGTKRGMICSNYFDSLAFRNVPRVENIWIFSNIIFYLLEKYPRNIIETREE